MIVIKYEYALGKKKNIFISNFTLEYLNLMR